MLTRLASFSFRHRWMMLGAWVLTLVLAVLAAGSFAGDYSNGDNLEGSDSTKAYELRNDEFPSDDNGSSAEMVIAAPQGIDSARTQIDSFLAELAELPGVTGVQSPFEDAAFPPISADGRTALAEVFFDDAATGFSTDEIYDAADELRAEGIQVEYASYWFSEEELPESEIFGLIAAVVILLVAFGSLVAMGLPMLTALMGIGIGLAGVSLIANVVPTPDFTVQVASMVGIGVGIDYALFIVTRYRDELRRGLTPHDATVAAINTSGRAVVFAGLTVMISLMGMVLMGLSFLYGLAVGTAASVAVAVAAAVTLLPAMLGFAGTRIDRFSIHRRRHAVDRETVWHRWSRLVQRHPKGFAAGGMLVLLLASAPALSMRMAVADMGNDPVDSTTYKAHQLRADGFGDGVNGPLIVVARTPDGSDTDRVDALVDAVSATDGVAAVTPVQPSGSGRAALFGVIPETGPQEEATENLVRSLRADVIPDSGLTAHVGGATASDIDFSQQLSDRLPIFIGAVLALSFLLLMAVFRSILVPLKAVVLNLLSIGAAYGVMVAVFQWGWLGSVLDITPGPIEPWAPMMLFAIVFGLSMDYEVFLLSSIHERYAATGDNSHAVVEGLAATARVITAAAAIMVCVFAPFVFGEARGIKLIGLGLAVAVFVDATVVRMVLVPSTMELLGRKNWWMPRWLDRALPHIAVEKPADVPARTAALTEVAR